MDASAAGNCAHNSENSQENVMNAAVGAVVVKPGAAGGAVLVVPETPETIPLAMRSGSTNNDASTASDLPAFANAAFDLAKKHCAWCK